jgi:hypothetical protein
MRRIRSSVASAIITPPHVNANSDIAILLVVDHLGATYRYKFLVFAVDPYTAGLATFSRQRKPASSTVRGEH